MPSSAATGRRDLAILGAILLLAAALRSYGLGTFPFEQDELYTIRDATDLGATASGPGIGSRPLYYLLQHLLFTVLPANELGTRIPAALFGLAGIAATWLLGTSLAGPRAGAVAAFATAISPWHIYASQFARYWTLVYLLAGLGLAALVRAHSTDRRRDWGFALVAFWAGAITHPTFVFPFFGALIAFFTVDASGRLRRPWPSRTALRSFVVPLIVLVPATLMATKALWPGGRIAVGTGRGLSATLGAILGMVQWLSLETVALATGLALLAVARDEDRRWGAMVLAGATSTAVLLIAAGSRVEVYADYGMAMLPLLFAGIGVGVERIVAGRNDASRGTALFTLVLAAAAAPGTLSHLSDGTRFEYRPAFARIAAEPAAPTLAWPLIVARHYGASLEPVELEGTVAQLDRAAADGPFRVVLSRARNGARVARWDSLEWLDANCRVTLRTGRPRYDYRSYQVELWECPGRSPP